MQPSLYALHNSVFRLIKAYYIELYITVLRGEQAINICAGKTKVQGAH
jgi:hypothetical protein